MIYIAAIYSMRYLTAALLVIPLVLPLSAAFPRVRSPAQPCDPDQCKLPNCRCAGEDIPGGLDPGSAPQIVLFSFDDGLRRQDYDGFYANTFNGRKNPNGCQIGLTFFVSHYYTDYALLEDVSALFGYEIADHTVDHNTSSSTTEEEWTGEIMEMKEMISIWGNVAANSVVGFRAPFLATNEAEIEVLYENKFLYEASMSTDDLYWPFTLDYKSPLCMSPATCPTNAYPGLWIVPVITFNRRAAFPATCWTRAPIRNRNRTGSTSSRTTSTRITTETAHRWVSTPIRRGSTRDLGGIRY